MTPVDETPSGAGARRERTTPASDLDDPALHVWLRQACAAVGVDPALVDVVGVHALTRQVSSRVARPMAPVGAMVAGLAVGAGSPLSAATDRLVATLPASTQ